MAPTFNSHNFEEIGVCGNPEIIPFDSQADYAQDVTEHGAMLLRRKWGMSKVSFDIGITGTANERRQKLSTLAYYLNVNQAGRLVLPDTPTWFYEAVPDGQITTERGINGEIANVSFTLTDPVAYGAYKSASFSSDSADSFIVGGNYPTLPTVSIRATPDSTSGLFGVYYDGDGAEMDVYMSGLSSKLVYFRCDSRAVEFGYPQPADSYPRTISLDSSWFKFTPTAYSRTVTVKKGTGTSGTVSWYERWL